eukprot:CAMPEP_0206251602 /NCGR_PEP_ID=MMETSP0047_2-20121206/22117_1 /ASSEMBLY_ACC=CAM_ASM_000192 /TAXON_ID=195065 /ORGANISM="Chroomonas mesostigmatica_cf, Strain CCMP1168" /LENGTH=74 /DNA_ID=CAMNT_0053677577 /DNA_START=1 /DNA_END=226 /DNA_ORIENTATION=+
MNIRLLPSGMGMPGGQAAISAQRQPEQRMADERAGNGAWNWLTETDQEIGATEPESPQAAGGLNELPSRRIPPF